MKSNRAQRLDNGDWNGDSSILSSNFQSPTSNPGFTLIEILVAMTVFSFLMLIVSLGILQVMRMYQADLATKRTQNAARLAMEDITREVRDSRILDATTGLCLQGAQIIRYETYESPPGSLRYGLRKITGGSDCTTGATATNSNILIDSAAGNVQVREFIASAIRNPSLTQIISAKIVLTVTTGDPDLFTDPTGRICKPGPGSQFCSTTSYSNIVSVRGGQ